MVRRNDCRGSNADRAARLRWLFSAFGVEGVVTCYRCGVPMLPADATADRIVPGWKGGRYVRSNLRPACQPCNSETGARLAAEEREAALRAERIGGLYQ